MKVKTKVKAGGIDPRGCCGNHTRNFVKVKGSR